MASTAKKKYVVVTAHNESVNVENVTRVEVSESNVQVTFYDGDEPVASFRGFNSYRRA